VGDLIHNRKDSRGQTFLHALVVAGNTDAVEAALTRDTNGCANVLMYSSIDDDKCSGERKAVSSTEVYFYEWKDANGRTPRDIAATLKRTAIVKILDDYAIWHILQKIFHGNVLTLVSTTDYLKPDSLEDLNALARKTGLAPLQSHHLQRYLTPGTLHLFESYHLPKLIVTGGKDIAQWFMPLFPQWKSVSQVLNRDDNRQADFGEFKMVPKSHFLANEIEREKFAENISVDLVRLSVVSLCC
jgi:hypothetical protein